MSTSGGTMTGGTVTIGGNGRVGTVTGGNVGTVTGGNVGTVTGGNVGTVIGGNVGRVSGGSRSSAAETGAKPAVAAIPATTAATRARRRGRRRGCGSLLIMAVSWSVAGHCSEVVRTTVMTP